MFPFESCRTCFYKCFACISPKPQTGTKRQLEAIEATEDFKPELTMKETEEVEPKKAKLSCKEFLTKVPVKPDEGTVQFVGIFFSAFGVCVNSAYEYKRFIIKP